MKLVAKVLVVLSLIVPSLSSATVWISRSDIMDLPTSGAAWERVKRDAGASAGTADVSNQDSNHDIYTLAQALVCVRTRSYCTKAKNSVLAAIGTESGGRWLAVGRNLTAYVIAADILNLRRGVSSSGDRVYKWIAQFLTRTLADNNTGQQVRLEPFRSGSNASAQEGAAYIAVGAYLRNSNVLDYGWDTYRRFVCDASAPDPGMIDLRQGVAYGWAHDNEEPCAINPQGTTKRVPSGRPGAGTTRRLDGSIINDMRRGGYFQWPPGYTSYPWVGLEGLVPAAVILDQAGYSAFDVADQAVRRTLEYLRFLRDRTGRIEWFDGQRADEIIHLVNWAYGTDFLIATSTIGRGRTVGYTDWTHPVP